MALPATDPESRLLALIDKADPKIRRAFITGVDAAKAVGSLDRLEQLAAAGRLDEALDEAVRIGAIRLSETVNTTFVQAGQSTATFLGNALEVVVAFDQSNDRAVNIMQQSRLNLIREFGAEQRRATRLALSEGIARGANPVEQARAFRDSIGLTFNQQRAVLRYRNLLERGSSQALDRQLRDRRFDSKVRRAVSGDKPLSTVEIDRMTDRYRSRMLRFRSETIARTEALRAVHSGSQEMYQQAIDEGRLTPSEVVQTWVTAHDERVRGTHSYMNGQTSPAGADAPGFTSGSGYRLRFPGDPMAPASETVRCRCALTTRLTGGENE